ncbi:hypothetical protein QJQ45_021928 [Haematococcus lacustris]|nr:hypothetical protein QJQ45_021928 [Haematococcus lacustris]
MQRDPKNRRYPEASMLFKHMEKEKVALAARFGLPDVAATYRSAPWGMHQRLARALFLQWIETKAENAIKQSKSPSSKDAEQATPIKAITGKDGRAFAAPTTPSGDEVQERWLQVCYIGNMGKLHWSFGAAWNSFGATQQQQPVMGNSQLVDGSLEQL